LASWFRVLIVANRRPRRSSSCRGVAFSVAGLTKTGRSAAKILECCLLWHPTGDLSVLRRSNNQSSIINNHSLRPPSSALPPSPFKLSIINNHFLHPSTLNPIPSFFSTLRSLFDVGRSMFNVRHPALYHPASLRLSFDILHSTLDIGHFVSAPPPSLLCRPSSVFRPLSSAVQIINHQ